MYTRSVRESFICTLKYVHFDYSKKGKYPMQKGKYPMQKPCRKASFLMAEKNPN